MPEGRNVIIKIVLDFLILAVVGFPILIFHLSGVPYHRGFFCDDDSIRYPFKESTVTNNVLYIVGIFLPVSVMCINEFVDYMKKKRAKAHPLRTLTLLGRPVPPFAWRLYKTVGVFLFGACLSQLTTDIAKYSIGRLRPHFYDVCIPNIQCTEVEDPHAYIEKYECQGTDAFRLKEARLSFPSGHSSFSAYTMFYTVLYLQGCMCVKGNKLLKPFLQFIFIMMTWSCGLSRISDYKHHWSDVLAGMLLGSVVALIVAHFVSDIFSKPTREEDNASHSTDGTARATNYNAIDLEQQ